MTPALSHVPTTVSVKPVPVDAPGRPLPLEVQVSAPVSGDGLGVVVFSHGNGWSLDGYGPLVDHWTAAGFVVVRPTHLDSRRHGIGLDDPLFGRIWQVRVEDLRRCIDGLDALVDAVPGLAGRVDRSRIAVAGHSWGAQSASMLLGARVLGPDGNPGPSWADERVRAGVLLAVAGTGGTDLTPFAAEHFPFMNPEFSQMSAPTLVVAGDADRSHLSTRGPDWWTDAYRLSPAPKALLALHGGEHTLGGVAGEAVAETTDENPARVALIRRVTTAYLRSALVPADDAWSEAVAGSGADSALGHLEDRPAAPSPAMGRL